ncbi:MAG: hypothetical protein ACYSTS_18090 [Planctomycetota bacterium]|jgi:hypothetical protein
MVAAALCATAGGPVTIGAAVLMTGMVIAVSAASQYRKNLKAKQVCLRISIDRRSTTKIWPYESKTYQSGPINGNLSFKDLEEWLYKVS